MAIQAARPTVFGPSGPAGGAGAVSTSLAPSLADGVQMGPPNVSRTRSSVCGPMIGGVGCRRKRMKELAVGSSRWAAVVKLRFGLT